MLRKLFLTTLLLAFFSVFVSEAQELDARVNINHSQVQGTSTSVFENLKTTLEQFLNERSWTDMQFKIGERIKCNFNITLNKYTPPENSFNATWLVQGTRPVYGSNYTTPFFPSTTRASLSTFRNMTKLSSAPTKSKTI